MEANMTVREAAIKTRMTFSHLYNLVRGERLPGAFKSDGEWQIPEAALNAYLEGRRNRQARAESKAQHGVRQKLSV
jgi:hypothetical protein